MAKKIITISEFSRQDILHLVLGVDANKVSVTHLSCDPIFLNASGRIDNSANSINDVIREPFVFCLGAEDPRKNTLRLVRAYLNLLKQNAIFENLVISGYANWEKSASYRAVKKSGAEDKVRFLNFVTIDELALLYRKAILFAYPSLYEGFGIPMLEAFSSGCPVIASNVTSIPEVGGDAALYFDPLNEDEIAQAILQVLSNPRLRDDLKSKGFERAKEFSWVDTAQKTLVVLQLS